MRSWCWVLDRRQQVPMKWRTSWWYDGTPHYLIWFADWLKVNCQICGHCLSTAASLRRQLTCSTSACMCLTKFNCFVRELCILVTCILSVLFLLSFYQNIYRIIFISFTKIFIKWIFFNIRVLNLLTHCRSSFY